MKQPCDKKCPDRSAECHSRCGKWLEYEKARNEEYARRAEEKHNEGVLYQIERDRKRDIALGRMKRRRNKKAFQRH